MVIEFSPKVGPTASNLISSPIKTGRTLVVTHHLPYECTALFSSLSTSSVKNSTSVSSALNNLKDSVKSIKNALVNGVDHHPLLTRASTTTTATTTATSTVTANNPSTIHTNGVLPHSSTPSSPSSFSSSDNIHWKFSQRNGHSAMYAGVRSIEDPLFIGMVGNLKDINGNDLDLDINLGSDKLETLKSQLLTEKSCIPIIVSNKVATGHYDGYCKTSKFKI